MRFNVNYYRHHALLMVRLDNRYDGHLMASQEGFTQGEPLTMIFYDSVMLLLTIQLTVVVTTCLQHWYADNTTAGGIFDEIERVFILLQSKGLARGYFPNPTKSIMVVKPSMVEYAKARFNLLGF